MDLREFIAAAGTVAAVASTLIVIRKLSNSSSETQSTTKPSMNGGSRNLLSESVYRSLRNSA
jgi:hypothetical protein